MIKRPKTAQRAAMAAERKKPSLQEDDFYANMAAMSDDDLESDISEADVDLVAKTLDDLDDMDANLFGGRKKPTEKASPKAMSSPRRTAGTSKSLSPSARTGNSASSSGNFGSKTPNKEIEEKNIPAEKKKPSVEDDIDLSGLLSDDDSSFLPKETVQSASKTSSDTAKLSTTEPSSIPKSSTATKQASPIKNTKEATTKDDSDLAGLFSDDESLLLPTTTKKDQQKNTTTNENQVSPTKPTLSSKSQKNTKETKESPLKKAVTFSKDDDIFEGLGLEKKPDDTSRPSRSALDDLFGKSSPPPLTFNTEKTETSQAGKLLRGKNESADTEKENDDFLFGSYMPSSANNSNRGSRSEAVPARHKGIGSAKNSFDYEDDDDDDWLKISSVQGSKSEKSETAAKVVDSDDDDDDWLGMKSSKKSVSFNFGEGLDIDLSPDVKPRHIRGGARNEKEIEPLTSALVADQIPSRSSVTKETFLTKSKPSVKTKKDISSPVKATQKESHVEKKQEPIKVPGTHKKEMSPHPANEEELLKQLEPINLLPSLGNLPVPNLEAEYLIPSTNDTTSPNLGDQHFLPKISGSIISSKPVDLRPLSADTHISSSSFEKITDAEVKISRLQIEKEQLEILIESVKKRSLEEIEAIEQSYKSRIKLLEETHGHKETRWKEENEELLKQHLQKMQQWEKEKSELTTRHYSTLQSSIDEHGNEIQRLKQSHQTAMELQCNEFKEALNRMKEVKQREVDSVGNFQSTTKSLHLVIEQIQANAKDLNVFQQKLDQWQIGGMDEREMSIRTRDQQLKILQERLNRQQEENARERSRLEELISRLETQLYSQTQLLDDERWKVKQEVNKFHSMQASLEAEKRKWGEQQAREKAAMDKSRNALMEEQRQLMSQMFEERRALAEEKVHMDVSRKMWTEREQKNSIKAVKIETEFDATMKALDEERDKLSVQLELVETEKKSLREDRKKFEKEYKNIEDEKIRLTEMASQIKKRSKEMESLFAEAQKMKEDGDIALAKSNKMDLEYSERWRDLMNQMDNLTEQEKQLSTERITLAQERDNLETLRKSLMCINCRNSISGGTATATVNGRLPQMNGTFNSTNTGSAFWGGYQPDTIPIQATEDSSPLIQDTLNAIRTDQWLRQLKKQSLKDKEFLLGEKVYLATLENSFKQTM